MIHDELRKFSIENKKFYYDLHGKNSKLCFTLLVVIINNNEEVKPKRVYTEAQIKAVKAYRERNRDSEEYKQRQE